MQGSQNSRPNKKPKHHEEKEQSWRTQNSVPCLFNGGKKKSSLLQMLGQLNSTCKRLQQDASLDHTQKKLTRKKSQIQIELKL